MQALLTFGCCFLSQGSFKGYFVEEASARFDVDTFLTVAANHFDVCRPESPNSSSFLHLVDFVRGIVDKVTQHLSSFLVQEAFGTELLKLNPTHNILGRITSRVSLLSADGTILSRPRRPWETTRNGCQIWTVRPSFVVQVTYILLLKYEDRLLQVLFCAVAALYVEQLFFGMHNSTGFEFNGRMKFATYPKLSFQKK